MATRGRGRASGTTSKPRTSQASQERQIKPPKSLDDLSGYLCSLTEQNLSNYGDMFADMLLDFATDEGKMNGAVNLIFDTTIKSRDYSSLGSKVCQKIVTPTGPNEPEPKSAKRTHFRKILMTRFQTEYKKKDATRKVSIEAWLSIFSFLCEIFNHIQVQGQPIAVVGKAILSTMEWLLQLQDKEDDEIDCICTYLKLCGKMLEDISKNQMMSLVKLLRTKVVTHSSSARVRCVILEVLEYRAMGWQDNDGELDSYFMDAIADATAEDDMRQFKS